MDITDHCPNKEQDITVEFVDEAQLLKWLPDPSMVVDWTVRKMAEPVVPILGLG